MWGLRVASCRSELRWGMKHDLDRMGARVCVCARDSAYVCVGEDKKQQDEMGVSLGLTTAPFPVPFPG